ncbi:hypothetical protein P43SY_006036 [Pythium insidiosum]|uniref:Uncharacterized protein n=1 Tax=Pythium insidiosum TaxID=114742 RepID=A0AAD5Q9D0_PYTIN|nr:hypothetical protein P43SY_006036 [Pythium insidiosum]KAJ0404778.1 hypothetical protein ATCC90586_009392 [Pythium insidiosum]
MMLRSLLSVCTVLLLAVANAAMEFPLTRAPPAACRETLTSPNATVVGALSKVFTPKVAHGMQRFVTDTVFGRILMPPEAHYCIANMDGALLAQTLNDSLSTLECRNLRQLLTVPFVNASVAAFDANEAIDVALLLKYLKGIGSQEMETFCKLYQTDVMPCLTTQVLPALSLVRSRYSGDCCVDWVETTRRNFGYTISGQIIKMAQLAGNLFCATQRPAFSGNSSQRCGFTLFQSLIPKPDVVSAAVSIMQSLQIPTEFACARAEGSAFVDINGNKVPAIDGPTISGCALPVDRLATWIYSLPLTQRSELFDVKALLEDGKCLQGSEIFPLTRYLLPGLFSEPFEATFNKTCVHIAMRYADGCNFSRPVELVDWLSEPTPIKEDMGGKNTLCDAMYDSAIVVDGS